MKAKIKVFNLEQDKLREHLHSEDYAGGDDELYFEIYGDI